MIQLDKVLEPLCKAINESYETEFSHLPKYPKFSFTRAMITLWKSKTYAKISPVLLDAYLQLLHCEQEKLLEDGKLQTQHAQ
jgi:hypothetical protein